MTATPGLRVGGSGPPSQACLKDKTRTCMSGRQLPHPPPPLPPRRRALWPGRVLRACSSCRRQIVSNALTPTRPPRAPHNVRWLAQDVDIPQDVDILSNIDATGLQKRPRQSHSRRFQAASASIPRGPASHAAVCVCVWRASAWGRRREG